MAVKKKEKIIDAVVLPHQCPQCPEYASTRRELDDAFGTRVVDGKRGERYRRRIAQSWCRACRSSRNTANE